MNDLTLSTDEKELLQELTKSDSVEVVWDINAFYFNTESDTYKLECLYQY